MLLDQDLTQTLFNISLVVLVLLVQLVATLGPRFIEVSQDVTLKYDVVGSRYMILILFPLPEGTLSRP